MAAMLLDISVFIFAYLCGSVSSAILTCRMMGLPDPRTKGSHNPGATNVLRIGGKKAAAITLLGDAFKGIIPVLLTVHYFPSVLPVSLAMLGAFLGHLFPIFFKFQGGKGVATGIGVMLAFHWPFALVLISIWLISFAVFRISSVGAILAAILGPVIAYFVIDDKRFLIVLTLLSLMLLWRHKDNIRRLLKGTEGPLKG